MTHSVTDVDMIIKFKLIIYYLNFFTYYNLESFSFFLDEYYEMFKPPSHRLKLSSVWGLVKLSLRVSPVIFRLQRAVEGGEFPVILLQPEG